MAKRIDRIIIDRILSEAMIEEVVGDFVDLKKKGVRYLGLCPFHDDRHLGSFVVYPKQNCFKCFKCDAKGGVVDFLMMHERLNYPDAIRWLGKKYNIETDMTDFNYTPPPPRPKPAPLPTLTLPMGMVKAREVSGKSEQGNLINWIKTGIRWDSVQRSRIDKALKEYHIGLSKDDHTIFWLIDDKDDVRTGKMMKYKTDGHRDKDAAWNFDFIHSTLSRRRDRFGNIIDTGPYPYPQIYNPERQEMRLTLFGMHLLYKYPQATVNVVESEKTALLMAIAYGNHATNIWMACGGMMNINRDRLAPIINTHRRIVLYPDRDGIAKWKEQSLKLSYDMVTVNTDPVVKWWLPEDGDKADIADVVVRGINSHKWEPRDTDEVVGRMPQVKPLIDKLKLVIDNDGKYNQ